MCQIKFLQIGLITGLLSLSACNKKSCDLTEIMKSNTADIQGNNYETVLFPNGQEWLASNLKTEIYNSGDSIPEIVGKKEWEEDKTGAFCYYGNSSTSSEAYGILYNFYAAQSDKQICPDGFHLPKISEWEELLNCLGGMNKAGEKLRDGTGNYWITLNEYKSTDESQLSLRPGGLRDEKGEYHNISYQAYFWASSETGNDAQMLSVSYGSDAVSIFENAPQTGASIRCIRD